MMQEGTWGGSSQRSGPGEGMDQMGMQVGWVGFGRSNLLVSIDVEWDGSGTGIKESSWSVEGCLTRD